MKIYNAFENFFSKNCNGHHVRYNQIRNDFMLLNIAI